MQPQLVTKPAFTVVGLVIRVEAKSPAIPGLWQQFGPRMGEVQNLAEPGASYGLMDHFDWSISQLDYLAGVPVERATELPAGMTSRDVPANTYAVFDTTLPNIGATFDEIFSTWLPSSGYRFVEQPYFEYYSPTFEPDDPAATVQIYIPVAKQA